MTSLCRNPPANQKPAERKTAGLIAAVASPVSLYFDVGDGVWKMDLLDRQAYFLSTPEILTEMLSEVAASHAVVPNTQNGNASENSTSATGELLGRTAIDGSNPKNTTIQDLQPQLLNQPFSFRQVSGSLVDSHVAASLLSLWESGGDATIRRTSLVLVAKSI